MIVIRSISISLVSLRHSNIIEHSRKVIGKEKRICVVLQDIHWSPNTRFIFKKSRNNFLHKPLGIHSDNTVSVSNAHHARTMQPNKESVFQSLVCSFLVKVFQAQRS